MHILVYLYRQPRYLIQRRRGVGVHQKIKRVDHVGIPRLKPLSREVESSEEN